MTDISATRNAGGFAVVASELRNMAQLSAEAGQSLHTIVDGVKILNDIIAKIAFENSRHFQVFKYINPPAITQMDDIAQ